MNMVKISNYQLFALIVLFQVGTTIIFGLASSAGRDAWIAVIISAIFGMAEIYLFLWLMRQHPGLTLMDWFIVRFGKWIGTPIAWLFPLLFLYSTGRTLRDLGEVMGPILLPRTPFLVTLGVMLAVICYVTYQGIETLARVSETLLIIILGAFCIEVVLLLSSPDLVSFRYLQPILSEGWGRIWKTVWPTGMTQSYGQTIEFAMIWSLVSRPEQVPKTTIYATLIATAVILISDILAISVFGEYLFVRSNFPLYSVLGEVSVGDFLENLNPLGVIYLSTMTFFKTSLHFWVSIRAIGQLTKIKNEHNLILPLALLVLLLSLTMASSLTEHVYIGSKVLNQYFWVPIYLGLPCLLLFVIWVQKLRKKESM